MRFFFSPSSSPFGGARGAGAFECLFLTALISIVLIATVRYGTSSLSLYALNSAQIALQGGGTDTVNPGGGCDGNSCTVDYCDTHPNEPGCFLQYCRDFPDAPECE